MARPALPSCASPHLVRVKSTGGSHFKIASRRLYSGLVIALRNRLDFLFLETYLTILLLTNGFRSKH